MIIYNNFVCVHNQLLFELEQNAGEDVSGEELHEILREIDTNMNGQVELDEYLQVNVNIQYNLRICINTCSCKFSFINVYIHLVIN